MSGNFGKIGKRNCGIFFLYFLLGILLIANLLEFYLIKIFIYKYNYEKFAILFFNTLLIFILISK